jgi:Uma2 family endonuclease
MSVQVAKWTFTTDEYHRMVKAGILSEDDLVELIEGEIVKMSPIGSRHAACVKHLNSILSKRLDHVIISIQDPIVLNDYSEPQPDVALLRPRDDYYAGSLPTADDVLLIIEVADTSVEYDRNVKLPLYALSRIPEVWLAVLPEDLVEAHSGPVNGTYQNVRYLHRGESISPGNLPTFALRVDDILG